MDEQEEEKQHFNKVVRAFRVYEKHSKRMIRQKKMYLEKLPEEVGKKTWNFTAEEFSTSWLWKKLSERARLNVFWGGGLGGSWCGLRFGLGWKGDCLGSGVVRIFGNAIGSGIGGD